MDCTSLSHELFASTHVCDLRPRPCSRSRCTTRPRHGAFVASQPRCARQKANQPPRPRAPPVVVATACQLALLTAALTAALTPTSPRSLIGTRACSVQPPCCAGAGNSHSTEYAHFRSPNDVFSDSVYGRPPSRFAPPRFNAAFNKAAGKPGERDGHRIIMAQPVDPPLPRSQVMVGEKQTRWPERRSAPYLYGKSGLYPSGSL